MLFGPGLAVGIELVHIDLVVPLPEADSVSDSGEETAAGAIGINGAPHLLADFLLRDVFHINFGTIHAAHHGQPALGDPLDFHDVILRDGALPDVDADFHHVLHQGLAETVSMVHKQHAAVMDGCGRIFHGLPARCAVNPELGYETEVRLLQSAAQKKKVMVIGSGPAGMEATQVLRERGHEVILVEKSDTLGGRLHDASMVSFKGLMRNYRDYMIRATQKTGATILLNTEATKELVDRYQPDAVFVATGSNYIKPPIPGIDGEHVHMLADVEHGRETVGGKVVVCGGGLSGLETAVDLARQGKDVTVIDMIPTEKFCANLFMFAYDALFMEVKKAGVKLQGGSRIVEFRENGVVVERNGQLETMTCDDVVIALGLKSENKLAKELLAADPMNTYVIGDADKVNNIRYATRTAYDAVLTMESRIL